MLKVKIEGIANMSNKLCATVLVGNLETIINISINELDFDVQQKIQKLLQAHVDSLGTSELIQKLSEIYKGDSK